MYERDTQRVGVTDDSDWVRWRQIIPCGDPQREESIKEESGLNINKYGSLDFIYETIN